MEDPFAVPPDEGPAPAEEAPMEDPFATPPADEPTPPAEEPTPAPPEEDPFATPPAEEPAPAEEPPAEDPFGAAPEDDPFSQNDDIQQMRTWVDVTGEYELKARFVEIIDGKVRLEAADGRYFRIAMDQLCAADLEMVIRHVSRIAQN